MRITLTNVSKGRRGIALPETSLSFRTGAATLAVAETEQRPSVLGLIASGRMRADKGTVTLDGTRAQGRIRRRVALIDAPDVCDPAPNVTVAGVVSEELMFAGRVANPVTARRWLDTQGLRHLANTPIGDVAPVDRIRMLLELAVLRKGVDGLVLVAPDRHGGDPQQWWALAQAFAARGFAVLVIAGEAAASALSAPPRTGKLKPSRLRLRRLTAGGSL